MYMDVLHTINDFPLISYYQRPGFIFLDDFCGWAFTSLFLHAFVLACNINDERLKYFTSLGYNDIKETNIQNPSMNCFRLVRTAVSLKTTNADG